MANGGHSALLAPAGALDHGAEPIVTAWRNNAGAHLGESDYEERAQTLFVAQRDLCERSLQEDRDEDRAATPVP
jgi:hypothetical protein